ncbi:DWNN-domain-containing protein [Fistulina hepatica ATCC 64428]|uniref:DWNN-domain-containing protein n=1 Tax=Fistulina hepatica ATCC 64428 TaxID=1128425 RepID=A0A0D7AF67_9AGAR|nr:DWNN-domain-containing protein [Fistulina hepatica ATCC 64428]KIY49981.1 DWNN-domain-containing protein [Fistulina hepatica ATCC 64428]
MTSSVFYRFLHRKDESRITFDGTGVSVFDLKREIILANNMGKANDFELVILDGTNKQEYADDSLIIPRSSTVLVKRIPSRSGRGKVSMYIAGVNPVTPTSETIHKGGGVNWHKGSMSKRFDGKDEPSKSVTPAPLPIKSNVTEDDEAAAMAAMFQAQTQNWEETQEKMSQLVLLFKSPICVLYINAQKIYTSSRGTGFPGRGGKPHFAQAFQQSDKPLPSSYVCYRCGQRGHWIKDCPTNNDRNYDNRPRIKRTTGIPRSMLKVIENPDSAQLAQGLMVTPEGGYVVAQPDSAAWQKQASRTRGLTAAEVRERPPKDTSLACPIDGQLFRDAMQTPCCHASYCEECIQTHLVEHDFTCPQCGEKVPSLDKLIVDNSARDKVTSYIEQAIEESKEGAEEAVPVEAPKVEDKETPAADSSNTDPSQQAFYNEAAAMGMDIQMMVDSIPQLQAQISQVSVMLQNSSLPPQVRQQTEMQYQRLQMELAQAQTFASLANSVSAFTQPDQGALPGLNALPNMGSMNMAMNPMMMPQGGWNAQFPNQQPAGQDSAYQRLPVNNRRRNLKRERPSDFLDGTGDPEGKAPRYWE